MRRNLARVLCASLAVVFFAQVGVVRAETPAPVSAKEKSDARNLIDRLYQAYKSRNLDKIMELEHPSIEASALIYEQQGKGKADDVRRAFREATEEVLSNKNFAMQPLHLEDVEYRHEGELLVVSSAVPIIGTDVMEVGEPGSGHKVRLRISKFVMQKTATGYDIVKMSMQ